MHHAEQLPIELAAAGVRSNFAPRAGIHQEGRRLGGASAAAAVLPAAAWRARAKCSHHARGDSHSLPPFFPRMPRPTLPGLLLLLRRAGSSPRFLLHLLLLLLPGAAAGFPVVLPFSSSSPPPPSLSSSCPAMSEAQPAGAAAAAAPAAPAAAPAATDGNSSSAAPPAAAAAAGSVAAEIAEATLVPELAPCLFFSHGGGPMPLLGAAHHAKLTRFLKEDARSIITRANPRAIVVVSAHWETDGGVRVSSMARPNLIFDYYGFPQEAYEYEYPAPGGDKALVGSVLKHLQSAGLRRGGVGAGDNSGAKGGAKADAATVVNVGLEKRGFDHGVFVPLLLARPEADIPIVTVSLDSSLDPALHVAIGRALAPLRAEGVMIVGSGQTYHNMRAFQRGVSAEDERAARAFTDFLVAAVEDEEDGDARLAKLCGWAQHPDGRACHPREEHLVPLLVVAGASAAGGGGKTFRHDMLGLQCLSALFE